MCDLTKKKKDKFVPGLLPVIVGGLRQSIVLSTFILYRKAGQQTGQIDKGCQSKAHSNFTYLKKILFYQEVNTDGDAALDKDEFASFFKSISTREEIVNLLKQFSSNGAHMTVEDFHYFLVNEQGVIKLADCWANFQVDSACTLLVFTGHKANSHFSRRSVGLSASPKVSSQYLVVGPRGSCRAV